MRTREPLIVSRREGNVTFYIRGYDRGRVQSRDQLWTPHRHEAKVFKYRAQAEKVAEQYGGKVERLADHG